MKQAYEDGTRERSTPSKDKAMEEEVIKMKTSVYDKTGFAWEREVKIKLLPNLEIE